ncbi:SAM-dependent methyltransferase [Nocardia sp. NPDC051570]|uniref:SAM-dependent methyltransferase n=1 Tax=Nocardia sp. NPDC051570 TaxID=3364324 RepID=UPI0037B9292E
MSALSGVEATAALIAAGRAVESERPDRLFDDPWARRFVVESGFDAQSWSSEQMRASGRQAWFVVAIPVRTRFLDDYVRAAVEHGCGQVVLLGAGLDTRALRIDWPSPVRFFELDTDSVLSFKASVLAHVDPTRAERIEVRVDLRDDWTAALQAAGFRADLSTAWIVEGLLQYLDESDVNTLMTRVARLSPAGSELGMSLAPRPETLPALPSGASTAADFRALWKWGPPADTAGWLAGYGWNAEIVRMADQARAYGRELPDTPDRPWEPGHQLVIASRD